MTARWERPSGSISWSRDDRGWVPYTPEVRSVRYDNTIQTVTVVATAGQLSLTYGTETTAAVAFNCSAAEMATSLTDLTRFSTVDLTVTESGGVYTIDFAGAFTDDIEAVGVVTDALTGTAVAAIVDPTETLTLSGNDTHIAEGFWRAAGRVIEARGTIRIGQDADLTSQGWWGVTVPTPAAGYTSHVGQVFLQDVTTGTLRTAAAMVFPAVDGDDPESFLIVLDDEAIGNNPVATTVPWTWADGDRVLWWVTYEPAEIET